MTLYDELTTGPLAAEIAPHLPTGNDGAIVGILNRKDIPAYGWITAADLSTWCALHNEEYLNIESLASNNQSPFYAAAKMLLNCLSGAIGENAINLAAPEVMALVNSWPFVDQTGAAKAALLAKGQKLVSRAEQLGIRVSDTDVRREIWNDNGSRKL